MATTNNNSDLIPKEDLNALSDLNTKLSESRGEMEKLLVEAAKVSSTFSKMRTDYKALIDAINQYNQVNEKVNTATQSQNKILEDTAKVKERIINASSKESKSIEDLRRAYESQTEASKQNANAVTQSASVMEIARQAYTNAGKSIDAQRQQLVTLNIGLSATQDSIKRLDVQYKQNVITEKEYVKRKAELLDKEQNQKTIVKDLTNTIKFNNTILNTSIGSYNNLSAVYSKSKIELNGLTNAETLNGKSKRQLAADSKALYNEMSQMQKETGKYTLEVGQYSNSLNAGLTSEKLGVSLQNLMSGNISGSMSTLIGGGAVIGSIVAGLSKVVGLIKDAYNAVKEFTSEGISMAQSAEGVRVAFEKMASPELLANLRKETKGLVSDYQLMQSAVKAKDYNIPIEQVGSLLKFAQQKAQETGKSVDYMVNSIFDGIGRKSPMILDNLQLTNVQIREAVNKTGDFTTGVIDLVNSKLQEQGDLALTSADQKTQADIKWQNRQEKIGSYLLGFSNLYNSISSKIADWIGEMSDRYLPAVIKRLEDIANSFIEIWNSSEAVRIGFGALYLMIDTFFIGLKAGVKTALDSLNSFAKITKSVLTLDFKGAATEYSLYLTKVATNTQQAAQEMASSVIKTATNTKNTLNNIDLTSALTGNTSIKNTITTENKSTDNNKSSKLADNERKALQDLAQFEIDSEAAKNKKLAENTKQSYEERINYVNAYEEKLGESIISKRDTQIADVEKRLKDGEINEATSKALIAVIYRKAEDELNKISEEGGKMREDIVKKNIEAQIKTYTDGLKKRNSDIDVATQEGLARAATMFAEGALSESDYQKAKTDIVRQGEKDRFDAEIAAYKQLVELLPEEEKAAIMQKIQDAELKYNKSINNQMVNDEEEKAKKILAIQKELTEKRKELMKELYKASIEFLSTMIDAEAERKTQRLEREAEENDEWRDAEIARIEQLNEAGAISDEQADARKAVVEQQAQVREDAINQKKKQVQIEQAKRQKAIALAEIATNTAVAIMKQLSTVPFPLATPLVAMISALGALQAATVLAQPLPAYKHGTDDHKGGHAIVGDGGKHELVIMPDGTMFKTPNQPTIMDLPKHSIVMSDYAKAISSTAVVNHDNKPSIVIPENRKQISLAEKNNKMMKELVKRQSRPIIIKQSNNNHNNF